MDNFNIDQVTVINKYLGIDNEIIEQRGLKFFHLEQDIISAGTDYINREVILARCALIPWQLMTASAKEDGIELQICSAYRTYEYQAKLIQNKLDRQESLVDIIKILAPPGYSEHHTGRAIDIISPEITSLSEKFEDTEAFAWLTQHASRFKFIMSYPRDNNLGFIYEPWHWCYHES